MNTGNTGATAIRFRSMLLFRIFLDDGQIDLIKPILGHLEYFLTSRIFSYGHKCLRRLAKTIAVWAKSEHSNQLATTKFQYTVKVRHRFDCYAAFVVDQARDLLSTHGSKLSFRQLLKLQLSSVHLFDFKQFQATNMIRIF